jgi:hypothetical protein
MKFRKLKAKEIDVRISQIASNYCILLLYKDARVDMNILDETVGAMNWKKSYLRDNANCIVSIWDEDKKEWVSKEDTGTESFSEAEKGLASDSFKRACFNWGIGRELYTAPFTLVLPKKEMTPKGKETEFYLNDKGKYDTKTKFWVEYIDYNEDGEIQNLIIRDQKNNIRFAELTKEKEEELIKLSMKFKEIDEEVREKIYKKYGVENDTQLLIEQKKDV